MSKPTHYCQHDGCDRKGEPCYLPLEEEPECYYCGEHAYEHGFCCACGIFSAGIESFDFLHPGFCDNCASEHLEDFDELDEHDYDEWEL